MDKIDDQVLKKFFFGKCSEEEKQRVIQWFVKDKYKDTLKFLLVGHWYKSEQDNKWKEYDMQEIRPILDKVHHKINIHANERQRHFSFRNVIHQFGRVAAILFLPLFLAAGWYVTKHRPFNNRTGFAEIVAPRGARIHFDLPDGSQGWLNSESTLKYPLAFSGKKRMVELTGEGYFEVVKNVRRPFMVKTGNIDVEVLGTKFDVNAYSDEDVVEVTLETGKVVVSGTKPGQRQSLLTEMVPGEQVHIRKADLRVEKKRVEDPVSYTAWKDGKLIFRNDPMDQVVRKLGRWYNVRFYLQERKLQDYRYHATFQYESLDEVLKLIKLTSPVDYKIIERKKLPDGSFSKKQIILFLKKA